jgi:hypothetical protein
MFRITNDPSSGSAKSCLIEITYNGSNVLIIAVTNKHTAKLHHVGSLYILTYDARKIKHKIPEFLS